MENTPDLGAPLRDGLSSSTAPVVAALRASIPSALQDEITARCDNVRAALLRLGDLPLPPTTQFMLGELYADFTVIASGIETRSDETRHAAQPEG